MRIASLSAMPAALGVLAAAWGLQPGTIPVDGFTPRMAGLDDARAVPSFVGTRDVELTFGSHGTARLVHPSSARFRIATTAVAEVTWTCRRLGSQGPEVFHQRERTTTTTWQGLRTSALRAGGQVEGFRVAGLDGTPRLLTETEGPQPNSCPTTPGGWRLQARAGDPVVVSAFTVIEVRADNGASWEVLQTRP